MNIKTVLLSSLMAGFYSLISEAEGRINMNGGIRMIINTILEPLYPLISHIIMDFINGLWNEYAETCILSLAIIVAIIVWPRIEKMIIKIIGTDRIDNIEKAYLRYYEDCKIQIICIGSGIYKSGLKIPKRVRTGFIFALVVLLLIGIGYMADYYISALILILVMAVYIGHLVDRCGNINDHPLLDAATIFSILSICPTTLELFYHSAALISGKVDQINTPSHLYLYVMCIVTLLFLLGWIGEKETWRKHESEI